MGNAGEQAARAHIKDRLTRDCDPARWPDTYRYAERDIEKAIEAAFDGQFGVEDIESAELSLPRALGPFRMLGSTGRFVAREGAFEAGEVGAKLTIGPTKDFDPGEICPLGTVLPIGVSAYHGPRSAFGNVVYVKKYECGWVATSIVRSWIS
jgi:hypothetical protein